MDLIDQYFGFLEVPERSRRALELRVRQSISKQGISDPSEIYKIIIGAIEERSTPYRERFFTRLDAIPNEDGRMFHELIAAATEEPVVVSHERLPAVYRELFEQLSGFLPGIALDTLVDLPFAPVSVVRERLEILEEKAKQSRYLIPPLRPVKMAYFTEGNEFVAVLGYRSKGFDALALYKKYYAGVTRTELYRLDSSLYQTLIRNKQVNNVPLKFGDPWGEYERDWKGTTRWDLSVRNNALYQRLSRHGLISQVPLAPLAFGDPWGEYERNWNGITRGDLFVRNNALYCRLLRHGLISQVPLAFGDPLEEYEKDWKGTTRGDLSVRNRALYQRLLRHGLISQVPLALGKEKKATS